MSNYLFEINDQLNHLTIDGKIDVAKITHRDSINLDSKNVNVYTYELLNNKKEDVMTEMELIKIRTLANEMMKLEVGK